MSAPHWGVRSDGKRALVFEAAPRGMRHTANFRSGHNPGSGKGRGGPATGPASLGAYAVGESRVTNMAIFQTYESPKHYITLGIYRWG